MSDPADDPYAADKLPRFQITTDELNRFFTGVGAKGACNVCGSKEWGHVITDVAPLWSVAGFPDANTVQPMVALRCKNCSNMRFHSFSGVKGWLESNPASGAGDEH